MSKTLTTEYKACTCSGAPPHHHVDKYATIPWDRFVDSVHAQAIKSQQAQTVSVSAGVVHDENDAESNARSAAHQIAIALLNVTDPSMHASDVYARTGRSATEVSAAIIVMSSVFAAYKDAVAATLSAQFTDENVKLFKAYCALKAVTEARDAGETGKSPMKSPIGALSLL